MPSALDTAARLRNAFNAFDVDKSGALTASELAAVLTRPGGGQAMSEEDAATLLKEADLNGDGVLSVDEFVLMMSGLKPEARFGGSVVDFSDLCGENGGCSIDDTAQRAITVDQLESIYSHVQRRLGTKGETWSVQRYTTGSGFGTVELRDPQSANLYDIDAYVIRPSTAARKCSMVELMASEEQPPDYFVSHWWGEGVLDFLRCLRQHTRDRHPAVMDWGPVLGYDPNHPNERETLGSALGRSTVHISIQARELWPLHHPLPLRFACLQCCSDVLVVSGSNLDGQRYWVCAHANNQHNLAGEIVDDLTQTSFFRAMKRARGTVSVIDREGIAFSRIWWASPLCRCSNSSLPN